MRIADPTFQNAFEKRFHKKQTADPPTDPGFQNFLHLFSFCASSKMENWILGLEV